MDLSASIAGERTFQFYRRLRICLNLFAFLITQLSVNLGSSLPPVKKYLVYNSNQMAREDFVSANCENIQGKTYIFPCLISHPNYSYDILQSKHIQFSIEGYRINYVCKHIDTFFANNDL